MQRKELQYRGKKIVYRTKGSGPLVMLLHGFGEDGTVWKRQFAIFSGYQLVVPDLPGTGDSEALDEASLESLADAVKEVMTAERGEEEKMILIGHSMGGYIALAFAERYPNLLSALGLFHSTAFADSDEKKETRRKGIRFIEEHGAAEFLKTATPNLYAPASREQHPEWIREHLTGIDNFSGASLVSYYMAMIKRPDRSKVLEESKVPLLFVMGRHDVAAPVTDGLKQCHLPQIAYIHILEQSGHMGMIEEELSANRILSQFVISIEKTA